MDFISRGYVCRKCVAFLSTRRTPKPQRLLSTTSRLRNTQPINNDGRPFKMAVIGSGPAGFYTAYRVMSRIQTATIDMYEGLPTPFGLVRYGVAPDHPEVKFCQEKFREVAESPNFNFIGNMPIGDGAGQLPLSLLAKHYDAILFAYGASEDRNLGIPGEDSLRGVQSARGFVGWYNGLPEFASSAPDLESGEEAVIIGQGNVAMDCARILLSDFNELRKTDISEQALETLSKSRIKSVRIVARRGPMQRAFTIKELRELLTLPNATFQPLPTSIFPSDIKAIPRSNRRVLELLQKSSQKPQSPSEKAWSLEFLKAPTSFNASAHDSSTLGGVTFQHQLLDTSLSDPYARAEPIDEYTTFPATLSLRSIGYKSTALPGLSSIHVPFDSRAGRIPNDGRGRILSPGEGPAGTSLHVPGMYCAGWVKNGPTGVIATTMDDAFITGDTIAQDWAGHARFVDGKSLEGAESTKHGWDGVSSEAGDRGVRRVDWKDWLKIDEAERHRGKLVGKERKKFLSVKEMLAVLD